MATRRLPVALLLITTLLLSLLLLAFERGVSFEMNDRDHHLRVAVRLENPASFVRLFDAEGNEVFVWQSSSANISLKLGQRVALQFRR